MNLILLTISPGASALERFWQKFKNFVRNRFFFYGGPQSVLDSLIRGLESLEVSYKLNPKADDIPLGAIVGVLSNVNALRWAIKAKRLGKIKKIIAGPNVMILPFDAGGVMLENEIDLILVPSEWVRDFWLSLAPEVAPKIKIWAAGVEDPGVVSRSSAKIADAIPRCLIYQKNAPQNLFRSVLENLQQKKIHFEIIKYGRYKKTDYFRLLEQAEFMIFLSKSESQGLALSEAWIRNVPTLVWCPGFMEWRNYRWESPNISAPYLTDECGMFFKDENDFRVKLPIFLEKLFFFSPRRYMIDNFTDKIAAEKYLKITNNV